MTGSELVNGNSEPGCSPQKKAWTLQGRPLLREEGG